MSNNHHQNQHVYGAQHPPSIKLIRELTTQSSASGSTSGVGVSSAATNAGSSGVPSSYRDYEKKTYDAWDIDDGDDEDGLSGAGNGRMFDYYHHTAASAHHLPISLADSDAVAKQIIRSHQEKQKSSASSSPSTPTTTTSSPSAVQSSSIISPKGPGPGKALRTTAVTSPQQEQDQQKQTSKQQQPTSISSDQYMQSRQQQTTTTTNDNNGHNRTSSSSSSVKPAVETSVTDSGSSKTNSATVVVNRSNSTSSSGSASRYSGLAATTTTSREKDDELARLEKFKKLLSVNPVDLNELQKACWKGIPKVYRHVCWKLLSDYLPLNQELQEKTIEQKRNAYWEAVTIHYGNTYIEGHHDMLRQILNDIPRMNPLLPIFQNKIIQDIFQRVLYVWAVRHPGTGYVQGINDLLTPFFVVFLTEYTDIEIQNLDIESISEIQRRNLEADCYWCMNKLLERIQENYVCSQPGIQKNIRHLEYLIKRIDVNLYNHLKKHNIEFIQFAFRWMNNLLMREIPLACTIRLWDTYHAEPFGFSDFHLYVCAAFLLRFSRNLCEEKDFQGLMMTLQNLPTKNLKASDIELLTAEAYQLQVMFANSPNHTSN